MLSFCNHFLFLLCQFQNACVVSVQDKQRYMGDEAAAIMKSNFKNTPMNIKRLLGRQFKEPEVIYCAKERGKTKLSTVFYWKLIPLFLFFSQCYRSKKNLLDLLV